MNRWVLVILSLIVGFGIGALVFKSKGGGPSGARALTTHSIRVYGAKGADHKPDPAGKPWVDPVKQEIGTEDVVQWFSADAGRDPQIQFKDEVFSGMTKVTLPDGNPGYAVDCKGRNCISNFPRLGSGEYKYWQILHNTGNPSGDPLNDDGWIIIK